MTPLSVVPDIGTMSKHDKTLDQIRRLNGGLHWSKVESLLKHMGAEVIERPGSVVVFVLDDHKMTFHRPHPRKECGRGLVKNVREHLKGLGRI